MELREVGSRLAIYHGLRIVADYRLEQDAVENLGQVVDMVKVIKQGLATLAECQDEPRRSQVLKALKP